MTKTGFLRARRPEQKQQRRDAILGAARELAQASGVRNVTLSAVAESAGLATSNISRYFGTREEIYLELLADEWAAFGRTVVARLSGIHDTATAIATVVDTIVERPLFCDLLSHLPTSLELNVSAEAARRFKHALHEHLEATGAAVAAAATELTAGEGGELVGAAGGMAGLLYRAANPPVVLQQVYDEDPELAATRPLLKPTLRRMLGALAAGLPTLREDATG